MTYYDIWQLERFGNILPFAEPNEEQEEEIELEKDIDYWVVNEGEM